MCVLIIRVFNSKGEQEEVNVHNHKALSLIKDVFSENDICYIEDCTNGSKTVSVFYSVECGPQIKIDFISLGSGKDIGLRIWGLVRNIPESKHAEMVEACNDLNGTYRYFRFNVKEDWINVEYDFWNSEMNEKIGEEAVNILNKLLYVIDDAYSIFMQALYSIGPDRQDMKEVGERIIKRLDLAIAYNRKRYRGCIDNRIMR